MPQSPTTPAPNLSKFSSRLLTAPTTPSFATASTPRQMATPTAEVARPRSVPSSFQVQMPEAFPIDTATNAPTRNEVFDRRAQLEQEQAMQTGLAQGYDAVLGRINTIQSPLVNPEETINRLLLRRPTEIQTTLDTARAGQAETTRGFAQELQRAGEEARTTLNVPGLQSALAETRNRIAERTTQLRTTLRDFEVNAERRGVAREFVESEKMKVQADAAAELADLAIIESAQLGNLNEARAEINQVLNEKIQAFTLENQAIEQEIARLEAMDTREADIRKEQLQIALQERNRKIEQSIADEREVREYMVQAASNGADQGTLDAIRRAGTPSEAAVLAGPWIGRMERQLQQAQLANIYDQINARAVAAREEAMRLLQEDTTAQEKEEAAKKADTEQALEIKSLAEQVLASSGLSSAVGFGLRKSVWGNLPFASGEAIAGTDRANFEASASRLANLLTLDNLKLMSGVLTDRDIQLLATAGSNLGNFNMSEAAYVEEINRIVELMNRTITNNGLTDEQAVFWGVIEQPDLETFNNLWDSL